MAIAIDTSVLLDVILADPTHADKSRAALQNAAMEGLIISETAIAELIPALTAGSVQEFLRDWSIRFIPSSVESAADMPTIPQTLAGKMYGLYLQRGGHRVRVVPDFLVVAHAQIHARALLARDRGYYRDYFQNLIVLDPS